MQILELHLATPTLPQQADFYTRILGFFAILSTASTLMLQAGASRLTFDAVPGASAMRYHFAFNIPENQFAEAVQWLRQRVTLLADSNGIDEFYSADWDSHGIYFFDPGGNVVEMIARHSIPSASQTPFSGRNVLSISEIGIAAEDVEAHADAICARSGATVYHGPPTPTFTAVGDEEGLFIVVRRGRIWFPETGVAAEHLPLTVITGPQSTPLRWQFA
jgi:hypothetical protein